ncbi:VanZ family protein [Paenibacillus sp. SC116]|uniref:VanZ family protein n=1 Tax=Paenibacillus sp. SC116 TaxID=2968986 RepID=UPI00215B54C5|nr:VanZ family protein [Paenibacillus sp. SC116]MCR8845163.1 VanZ family protein [Paenibacillus sp. SC116]
MNLTTLMNSRWLPVAFGLYMYTLLKIILFKFHSIDMTFMLEQVQMNIENPHSIIKGIQLGNLVPFKEISHNIQGQSMHGLIHFFGNIALFIPLGIFLLLLSKNKKASFISVLVCSFGVSFSLEIAQVIFSIGNFDVDDLILNTTGGILGYWMSRIVVYLKLKGSS